MEKWVFYVLVFVYMCYRAVYGAKVIDTGISVDQIKYGDNGFLEVGSRKTVNCRASNRNQRIPAMPFSVVQTIEKGELRLTAVPDLWVHNKLLFWPKKSADKLRRQENRSPDASWEIMSCDVKRKNLKTFQEAQDEIDTMSDKSDTETDEGDTNRRSLRKEKYPLPDKSFNELAKTLTDLEWVDPFGNVVKRIPSNRVYAQEHFISTPKGSRIPGLVLTLSKLLASDSGIYQCRSGEQKKNVRICAIKPSEFVDTPTEITIEAGRSITLTCQAKGDPEPRLVWNKNGEVLAEGEEHPKYRVNTKYNSQGFESLLTITSVEPDDADLYTCVSVQLSPLDNCTHSVNMNVTLRVEAAPIFKYPNETEIVYGKINEIVDIKCAAKGWPKPTYRWFKDLGGEAMYEFDQSKIVFTEEPNTAVLSVTAGPTTFGSSYKCKASNGLGDSEKYFKLLRREKPWKADHVWAGFVASNHIYFNVTWDDETFFPIDSFEIQYLSSSKVRSRTPDKYDWKKAQQVEKKIVDEDDDEEEPEGFLIELNDLESESEYFIRVRAVNEAGEGPWSDTVRVFTIEETVTESEEVEKSEDLPEGAAETNTDNGMFYGIFFAGGIMIVAVVCMFAMRLV